MHFFFIFSSCLVVAGSASSLSFFSPHGLLAREQIDENDGTLVRRGACLGRACRGVLSTKHNPPQESPGGTPNQSPPSFRPLTPPPMQPAMADRRSSSAASSKNGSPSRPSLPTIPSERLIHLGRMDSTGSSDRIDAEGRPWNFNQRMATSHTENAALVTRSLSKRGGCLGKVCLDPGAEERRRPGLKRYRPAQRPVVVGRRGGGAPALGTVSPTRPIPGSVPVSPSGSHGELASQPSQPEARAPFKAPREITFNRSPTPFPRPASHASSMGSERGSPRAGGPVLPGSPRLQGLAAMPGKVGDSPENQSPPRTKSEQDIKDMLVPDAGPGRGSPPRLLHMKEPLDSAP